MESPINDKTITDFMDAGTVEAHASSINRLSGKSPVDSLSASSEEDMNEAQRPETKVLQKASQFETTKASRDGCGP